MEHTFTREELAILNGYVPNEEGVVISPKSGKVLNPFEIGPKASRKLAFKFWDSKVGTTRKPIIVYLHRVVWTKHSGKIPEKHIVFHKDGDFRNNAVNNLDVSN